MLFHNEDRLFYKEEMHCFRLKSTSSELVINKEVNGTDPSLSIRIPCLIFQWFHWQKMTSGKLKVKQYETVETLNRESLLKGKDEYN